MAGAAMSDVMEWVFNCAVLFAMVFGLAYAMNPKHATAVVDSWVHWTELPPACQYRAEPQGDGTYKLYRC
jgi:hypothetical protein